MSWLTFLLTFNTTTNDPLELSEWPLVAGCTHVA
jgi:hypothetical protein